MVFYLGVVMDGEIVAVEFNYEVLDSETRQIVRQQTGEIRNLMHRTAGDIIEIGRRLTEVKERLPHGAFGPWLEAEFKWTDRTARKYMQVAEAFKTESDSVLNIAPTVLYQLASPSTPPEVRAEVVERAQAGEKVSKKDVEKAVREANSQPDKSNVRSHSKAEQTRQAPKQSSGYDQSDNQTAAGDGSNKRYTIDELRAMGVTVILPGEEDDINQAVNDYDDYDQRNPYDDIGQPVQQKPAQDCEALVIVIREAGGFALTQEETIRKRPDCPFCGRRYGH